MGTQNNRLNYGQNFFLQLYAKKRLFILTCVALVFKFNLVVNGQGQPSTIILCNLGRAHAKSYIPSPKVLSLPTL